MAAPPPYKTCLLFFSSSSRRGLIWPGAVQEVLVEHWVGVEAALLRSPPALALGSSRVVAASLALAGRRRGWRGGMGGEQPSDGC